jgi:hypothetical protein
MQVPAVSRLAHWNDGLSLLGAGAVAHSEAVKPLAEIGKESSRPQGMARHTARAAAWLLPNFNRLCDRNHFPAPKKPA